MKVKCIISHEKPIGIKYEAGKIYEKDEFDRKFFKSVREKKETEIKKETEQKSIIKKRKKKSRLR